MSGGPPHEGQHGGAQGGHSRVPDDFAGQINLCGCGGEARASGWVFDHLKKFVFGLHVWMTDNIQNCIYKYHSMFFLFSSKLSSSSFFSG